MSFAPEKSLFTWGNWLEIILQKSFIQYTHTIRLIFESKRSHVYSSSSVSVFYNTEGVLILLLKEVKTCSSKTLLQVKGSYMFLSTYFHSLFILVK